MDLSSLVLETAQKEGFPLAGLVDIDLAFQDPAQTFTHHVGHFDQWIHAGYSGAMDYLVRGRDRRADPRLVFPLAESVLCVAIPYPRRPAGSQAPENGPRYARYLQGDDYHLNIAEKLEKVMSEVKAKADVPDLKWKICVDTSAILERSWAALAGLGWIGKNTLLINPKLGSYIFLAEVLLNVKTGRAPAPLPNYCGNCTRCLNHCPTQALIKPHVLNSNRCVSYWTLEKRGDLALSEQDRKKMGSWIAGCDLCQEICPFNMKPTREELSRPSQIDSPNATQLQTWRDLLLETVDQYKLRVKNSAMKRIKPAQFSRNIAISLSQALTPSLYAALRPLIEYRFQTEADEVAKKEWQICLDFEGQAETKAIDSNGNVGCI